MSVQWVVQDECCGWAVPGLRLPKGLSTEAASVSSLENTEMLLDCELRNIYRAPLRRDDQLLSCFLYFFRQDSLYKALSPCPAFHILRTSQTLREHGFESLEVLAALKPRRRFLHWHSLLIAVEIESVLELPSTGDHVFQIHEWIDFDINVASKLARELARFHDAGFIHGDLKSRHVLTRLTPGGGLVSSELGFVFVDLEKTRYLPYLPFPARDTLAARDLIQLLASLPTETVERELLSLRQHFLGEYMDQRKISPYRANYIRRVLDLYGPGGTLVQGKTVLGGLISNLTKPRNG